MLKPCSTLIENDESSPRSSYNSFLSSFDSSVLVGEFSDAAAGAVAVAAAVSVSLFFFSTRLDLPSGKMRMSTPAAT